MRSLLVAMTLLFSVGQVRADEAAAARAAFERGVAAYTAGRMDEALEAFREAYRIKPNPVVLYNIGQAEADLGRSGSALSHFEQYLREARQIPAERRKQVRREIEQLKAKAGHIELDTNVAGGKVTLDGVVVGTTPLGRSLMVDPGHHRLTVTRDGFEDYVDELEVAQGETARLNAKLAAIGPAPVAEKEPSAPREQPVEPPARSQVLTPVPELDRPAAQAPAPLRDLGPAPSAGLSRKWFWTGVGVTSALFATATVTGLLALSRSDEYNDPNTPPDRRRELRESGTGLAHVTDALLVSGAVAAGATLLLYFKTDWSVAPAPNGMSVAKRF